MSSEFARPRPAIELMSWGEIKVDPKRSREVVAFLKKLDSVIKVDNKGGGIIHVQTKDPSISLIVSRKFKKSFIHFRSLQMKATES